MKKIYQVTAFTYLARQDGNENGMVKDYEVYLSTDGTNWGSPVVSGSFNKTTALQIATLASPTAGRYLKFVALSEINGKAWTSAAEIGIEASADVTGISIIEHSGNLQPDDTTYDLNGRKVTSFSALTSHQSTLPKGVYIHHGKKMLR